MYEIEKGVEVPKKQKLQILYPFPFMEIGDSFIVGKEEGKKVTSSLAYYNRKVGNAKKFTTRTVPEGVRCWRVE